MDIARQATTAQISSKCLNVVWMSEVSHPHVCLRVIIKPGFEQILAVVDNSRRNDLMIVRGARSALIKWKPVNGRMIYARFK